jgi:transcriptional regulator with XRE-family HTH domain
MRGKSQLDLSLDTGISQRQISFIESGRSTPGRHNLLHLADALDVPFRERNALLLAAASRILKSKASRMPSSACSHSMSLFQRS